MRKFILLGAALGVAFAVLIQPPATAGNKVDVCHKDKNVLNISSNAVNAHLAHGDNVVSNEACNGVDDDCDQVIDEGVSGTFYLDADGDGRGSPDDSVTGCDVPDGYVKNDLDSDDDDPCAPSEKNEACDEQKNAQFPGK
jgi:hypothetical protein